jgi:hypothetical protein
VGVGHIVERVRVRWRNRKVKRSFFIVAALVMVNACLPSMGTVRAQTESGKKSTWHSIEFGIIKFNDQAPNSWNIYHGEKKGLLLVRLWKRYLFVDVQEAEVYDIDPRNIKVVGDAVEWSLADVPEKPIDTPEWKARDVGLVQRVRFRLGKDGHYLELQIPLATTGKPIY